jgi:hypothetical protein
VPTATETPARKPMQVVKPGQHIEAWRIALGLNRGSSKPWHLKPAEVRFASTSGHTPRPLFGANKKVWERAMAARRDSAALARARFQRADADHAAAVDDFVAWLDSEDFGKDPQRIRREAWR